ncbi:hypothetical protein [Oceanithermus sp.]
MAVFAGGQVVLLGHMPDYHVIPWLPWYNFTVGVITVVITALLLWKALPAGRSASLATFAAHATVMTILLTAYRNEVAIDSLRAMTIRLTAWTVILLLIYWQGERAPQQG